MSRIHAPGSTLSFVCLPFYEIRHPPMIGLLPCTSNRNSAGLMLSISRLPALCIRKSPDLGISRSDTACSISAALSILVQLHVPRLRMLQSASHLQRSHVNTCTEKFVKECRRSRREKFFRCINQKRDAWGVSVPTSFSEQSWLRAVPCSMHMVMYCVLASYWRPAEAQ
jgi:hypothetical protein